MKLFYVYYHDREFVPIHVSEILHELQKRKHKVTVFTSVRNKKKQLLGVENIRLYNIPIPDTRFISELIFMVCLFPFLLIGSLRDRPDAFYCRHSASSSIVTFIAKLIRKPCLLEVNDINIDKIRFEKVSKLKILWINLYHYLSIRLSKQILPVTSEISRWIRVRYYLNKKHVREISNGVNVHRFKPKPKTEARQRYKIPNESPVLLSLGSLFPWAGIETVIAAAPKILEIFPETLFLIGSGEEPYLTRLKKIVNDRKLNKCFRFYGFIHWDEASWFISTADICIAPFIIKENRSGICSLRVLSYLACEKPVIGSDIIGLGDMLEKEGIGKSFPMGDSLALSEAIIRLIQDANKIETMGKKARKFVIDNYSWENVVCRLEKQFYESISNYNR